MTPEECAKLGLLNQYTVTQVIGEARLLRFMRAGWLEPAQRTPSRILFRAKDVHAALRRLERGEICPSDQIASARTNKNYVPRPRTRSKQFVTLTKFNLDYVPEPVKPPDLVFNLE
jgi:hypothetical protein